MYAVPPCSLTEEGKKTVGLPPLQALSHDQKENKRKKPTYPKPNVHAVHGKFL